MKQQHVHACKSCIVVPFGCKGSVCRYVHVFEGTYKYVYLFHACEHIGMSYVSKWLSTCIHVHMTTLHVHVYIFRDIWLHVNVYISSPLHYTTQHAHAASHIHYHRFIWNYTHTHTHTHNPCAHIHTNTCHQREYLLICTYMTKCVNIYMTACIYIYVYICIQM